MCFSKEDIIVSDSLSRPLSMEELDESLWSDKFEMRQSSSVKLQLCSHATEYMQPIVQYWRTIIV